MASSTMPKQLGELLQEQQEPFILELYLHERGHMRNHLNSDAGFRCCSGNSSSFLKRSASWGLNKRRKIILNCSNIMRAVCKKLLFISSNRREKSSVSRGGDFSFKEIGASRERAESERFSSASSTTVFNSLSESDVEDGFNPSEAFKLCILQQEKQVVADRKLQRRCREDNEELSPVSVLEELPLTEDSPVHENNDTGQQPNAKTRDSIFAVPFYRFIIQSSMDEPSCTKATASEGCPRNDSSSQYLTAKRVMQQSKQLLFSCMRELVESCARKDGSQQHVLEFSGPEELGKLLSEDTRTWTRLCGEKTSRTEVHSLDFTASAAQWSHFGTEIKEIGAEIGNAIFEDISKEIVLDMIELCDLHSCSSITQF